MVTGVTPSNRDAEPDREDVTMAKSVTPATGANDDGYRVPAVERAFVIIRVLAAGSLSLARSWRKPA